MISIPLRSMAAAQPWPAGFRHAHAWRLFQHLFRSLLLFILLQTATTAAFAHASLIETIPADGAMLRTAPADITLHFNEPVAPLVFKLALPDGTIRPLTQTVSVTNGLKLSLPELSAPGTYLLSWRVVSADSHPVGGAVVYSVGMRSGANATAAVATAAASEATPPPLMAAIWLTRYGLYLALFIGVGAVLFRAFMLPAAGSTIATGHARWPVVVLVAGLLLLPLAVGLQGLDALELPWNALGTWAPWQTSLSTAYGTTARLMLASLIAALVATHGSGAATSPRRAGRSAMTTITAIAALLLLGAALAASGHASSAPPQWLARPTVFLHGMAIALWVGSLLPLILLLKEQTAAQTDARTAANQRIAVLLRFSRMIPWVLTLLLASGATLLLLQLGSIASLWSTDYGRILSAKLILVGLLLIVAAINRYALTERMEGDAEQARRGRLWMRRLIGVELGLVLLVLALATTWRFTPPPRALAAMTMHPMPVSVHIHGEQAMVDLTLSPQPDRSLRAALFVQSADFSPLNAQEVSVEFSNPALGIEPLQKDAHRGADGGNWTVDPFALPAPGRWHVRVNVLISDFETTAVEQDVNIAF
jgi:copper transport protein